ncbi:hypothetical protein MCOR02_004044 [Pyricularia oryzae]|nr:hypothetical protein MCOR02_004044 [Pyricularia oryzae]
MVSKLVSLFCLASAALVSTAQAQSQSQTSPSCDSVCQAQFRGAVTGEDANYVNLDITTDSFYQTPANISSYAVGDLVKSQDLDRATISRLWTLPAGMSMSRIYYVTEDIDGKPLPATAFALIPYSNPLGPTSPSAPSLGPTAPLVAIGSAPPPTKRPLSSTGRVPWPWPSAASSSSPLTTPAWAPRPPWASCTRPAPCTHTTSCTPSRPPARPHPSDP